MVWPQTGCYYDRHTSTTESFGFSTSLPPAFVGFVMYIREYKWNMLYLQPTLEASHLLFVFCSCFLTRQIRGWWRASGSAPSAPSMVRKRTHNNWKPQDWEIVHCLFSVPWEGISGYSSSRSECQLVKGPCRIFSCFEKYHILSWHIIFISCIVISDYGRSVNWLRAHAIYFHVSKSIISYHGILFSYHVLSYRIIAYHIMPYLTIPYTWYYTYHLLLIAPGNILPYHVMSHDIIP